MGVAEAFSPQARRGQSERVGHALRRDIVLGRLAAGEALRELDLADRFGVSQGTIREALMRLSEEGLVMRRARRDTHVAPATPDDVRELLHIRHEIECRAAGRVIAAAGPGLAGDLSGLLQAMRLAALQGDEYALLESDCLFHLRLFGAAECPVVEPVLARCLVHTQRFKILTSQPADRDLLATADRHLSIVEAVQARDAAALAAALSHHITTIVDCGPEVIQLGSRSPDDLPREGQASAEQRVMEQQMGQQPVTEPSRRSPSSGASASEAKSAGTKLAGIRAAGRPGSGRDDLPGI